METDNTTQKASESTSSQYSEDEKLNRLKVGLPLHFSAPKSGIESKKDKDARTIRASWIEELIKNKDYICDIEIDIKYAIIDGPLNLLYATFQRGFSIKETIFTNTVNFSYATFERSASFGKSEFRRKAEFQGAHTKYNFDLRLSKFAGTAIFRDMHVEQNFGAEGALFSSANFDRIHVDRSAFFKPFQVNDETTRTRFFGEVGFRDAQIQGNVSVEGCRFFKQVNFNRINVGGGAYFGSIKYGDKVFLTHFDGDTFYSGATINGSAGFVGTQFNGKADFELVNFGGGASFRPAEQQGVYVPVRFRDAANFFNAQFQSRAVFDGSQFKADANFERVQINGIALIRAFVKDEKIIPIRFSKRANFLAANISSHAVFSGAQFEGSSKFVNLYVGGRAFFSPIIHSGQFLPVRFGGKVEFTKKALNAPPLAVGMDEPSWARVRCPRTR